MEASEIPSALKLALTRGARRFIRQHGNRVFIWEKAMAADVGLLECDVVDQGAPGLDFETHLVDGVEVNVARDIPLPRVLGIGLTYFPRRHLVAAWGSAGVAAGLDFAPPVGGC